LWDFDPVEIARPASGAYERLPLVQIDSVDPLIELQRRGLRLYGCIAGAKRTIYDIDLTGPAILAIGGEKRGLSGAVRALRARFPAPRRSPHLRDWSWHPVVARPLRWPLPTPPGPPPLPGSPSHRPHPGACGRCYRRAGP